VTEAGFDLRRLPTHTFEWLRDWYYAEMARSGQSEEGLAGPCMNQHAAPTLMVHLPQTGEFSKDRLSRELQEELEGWYGKGPLRLTSIYGIRRYVNGSVLRMHVDTANTHVVSGIINVDQQVEEPWLLKILDHDDQEHDLPMRPGDLLLYESAKLLHGRPEPFKGDFYDNIFIHYMPVSGWDYNWI
jgi:prolyl 4-hydroxylase